MTKGLTAFHIEGLTTRASGCIEIFVDTLRQFYWMPRWVKSKVLEKHFGLTGPEIRGIIHHLRTQGHLIASSSQGYCYTRNINSVEIQDTIKHLSERSNSMRSAVDGMVKNNINEKRYEQEEMF